MGLRLDGFVLVCVLLCASVRAQEPESKPADRRLEQLVTLESHHPWAAPSERKEWALRREEVRRQVLVSAGLWPGAPECDPRPVIGGLIERDGYTVERVRFESLPGFFVTGSLYRPRDRGEEPGPAVLSPHGHFSHGRFTVIGEDEARKQIELGQEEYLPNAQHHLQARCVQLCRMGCVVFHYDMIGYADSTQLDHRSGFGDVQAELWGMSHFGLQTLDTLRAYEFLASLPDVDPERIAVTGASGGGTQTFILGAIDDRPAVLFPAVMVSTHMQGGCVCENASGLRIRSGNVELAAMAAPRPLGLTGANDWTLQILEDGLPQLQELYRLLDVPDLVAAWCYPVFPHNYNRISRGHMYQWMNEHLRLGLDEADVEPPIEPLTVAELTVYSETQRRPEDALDLGGVRAALMDHALIERLDLAAKASEDPDEYRRIVAGALESMIHAALPGAVEVWVEEQRGSNGSQHRHLSPVGAGHQVLLETLPFRTGENPGGDDNAVLLVVLTGELSPRERDLLARWTGPRAVVHLLSSAPIDERRHAHYPGYTWGYNLPLLAHRVQDILTAVVHLESVNPGRPLALIGFGESAPAALIAAALAPGSVARVAVDGTWDFDRITSLADPNMLPRALRHGGMGAFAALVSPRPLLWMGEQSAPLLARALFGAEDASGALTVVGETTAQAVDRWLREQ